MKKKTNKLAKLERDRYSIFTNDFDKCYYCGIHKSLVGLDIHEVYGGANRITSMKNGLCVPLCRKCHQNNFIINDLKKWCQRKYEQEHTRAEFIKMIGKSYL